mgnify:CR=1 FL=1
MLLQFDASASFFQLLLRIFGDVLTNVFEDIAGSAFDEVLGFLQAEAGQCAHDLDDLDLLGASILEDETPDTYRTLNDQEHARMAEAGMTRLTLSDSVATKLDDAVVKGAWAFAETRDGETAVRLRAAVEAAGLLE